MKRTVGILLFVMLGCQDPRVIPVDDVILGQWEWVISAGGIDYTVMRPSTEGYTQQIEFTGSGDYLSYRNDTLLLTTGYSLSEGTSIFSQEEVNLISLDGDPIELAILYLKKDTMQLGENCTDCFSHLYIRKK